MKTLRLLILFGALAGSAFAATIPASSTITAATVYADRAVVTRTARIDLPAGQSELTFAGLPADLSDQSLQVAGHGIAATILDVNARFIYTEKTSDPRVLAAEADLNGLQHQDRILKDKATALDQQRALLARIETAVTQPPTKDTAAPRRGFDDWQKLLTSQPTTPRDSPPTGRPSTTTAKTSPVKSPPLTRASTNSSDARPAPAQPRP